MANIGKQIRLLRIQKQLTQDELADKLFVSRQTVSNYETGKSNPDIDMLLRIAKALDCDVNVLIFGPADRRLEKRKLWKLALAAVCTFALFWLYTGLLSWSGTLASKTFDLRPSFLIRLLLRPAVFVCLGVLVMQLAQTFFKARPLAGRKATVIFYTGLFLLLFYFLNVTPFCLNLYCTEASLAFGDRLLLWSNHFCGVVVSPALFPILAGIPFPFFPTVILAVFFFCGAALWNGPEKKPKKSGTSQEKISSKNLDTDAG